MDIVDLQEYIKDTENSTLIAVFQNLECGSRNHLRSFIKGIVNIGDSYTPQFLTEEAINNTTDTYITQVYSNLLKASQNHLSTFNKQLSRY